MATEGNGNGSKFERVGTEEAPRSDNVFRQAKNLFCEVADDIIDAGEEIIDSPVSKKIAAGAAVGALVAAPLPIVGWAAGATIGAGLVAFKNLRGKD
jgi:hypothetical protein